MAPQPTKVQSLPAVIMDNEQCVSTVTQPTPPSEGSLEKEWQGSTGTIVCVASARGQEKIKPARPIPAGKRCVGEKFSTP
ncbi:hypothetical protein ZHAS_00014219 [Anopheles sinensis]|uniref:Uncharacterized protein n=1 Tax=Anopheles sinensis TaxID=74873 RepID=A0A084W7M0_ANOSI|nr:hypothetical protein ZHAS_00014219 [Anopheles sinensis]